MLTIEQFRQLWQLLACYLMDDNDSLDSVTADAGYTLLSKITKIMEENL